MASVLAATSGSTTYYLATFVLAVLQIVGAWLVFRKAGRPGWAAIIPIYDVYVTLKIVGRSGWWLVLFFIPLVNLIVFIVIAFDLSRSFGHGNGYALGLVFFPFLFLMILGFGSSRYLGPAVGAGGPGY